MSALEHAMMLQALIDMNPKGTMAPRLRQLRDQIIAEDVPAELAHHRKMSDWLFDGLNKTIDFSGDTITIPLSYK